MPNRPALRPRSVGELLDTALWLYRTQLRLFLGRVAAALLPIIVFRAAIQLNSGRLGDWQAIIPLHPDALPAVLSGLAVGIPLDDLLAMTAGKLIFFVLVLVLLTEFLITSSRQAYLGELAAAQDPPTISYGTTAALVPAVLLTLPLSSLVALLADALGTSALLGSMWFKNGVSLLAAARSLASIYGPELLGYSILMLVCLPCLLAAQAVVIEGCGSVASLRRSWRLTRGSLWAMLQVTLIVVAIMALMIALPLMLASVALAQDSLSIAYDTIERVGQALSQLMLALCLPFQIAAFTILYYDLRVRKEAYDLEVQSRRVLDAEVTALNGTGIARWNGGDLAGAQADFDRVLTLNPGDYMARSYRIAIAMRREEYTSALRDANQAIQYFPDDIATLGNRGYIRHKLGDREGAREDYMQALRRRPDEQRILVNSIALRFDDDDQEGALQELEYLLKLNPNHDWALYNSACVLARLGRIDAALDQLAQASAVNERWLEQARRDADFEGMRDDPRLIGLLADRGGAGAAL